MSNYTLSYSMLTSRVQLYLLQRNFLFKKGSLFCTILKVSKYRLSSAHLHKMNLSSSQKKFMVIAKGLYNKVIWNIYCIYNCIQCVF